MTIDRDPPVGGRLKRLLVCFDGSEEAKQAIELGLDLGKSLGAELTIFSVLSDTSHLETTEAQMAAERHAREDLDTHLTGVKRRAAAAGITLKEVTEVGLDPADTIDHYAAEHGFDLVVIGSHGQEAATHRGLGRAVERLLRDPRFPVLVAPRR